MMGAGDRAQLLGTLQRMLDDKRAEEGAGGEGDETEEAGRKLSGHEQRLARMGQRARRLEEENMGEKDWFMRGETKSGQHIGSTENADLLSWREEDQVQSDLRIWDPGGLISGLG